GRKRGRALPTIRDWVSASATRGRGVHGAKPKEFCFWLFEVLGLKPEDDFQDLFYGSGAVTDAWEQYKRQPTLWSHERSKYPDFPGDHAHNDTRIAALFPVPLKKPRTESNWSVDVMAVEIDPEFRCLIPQLTDEERKQLEENLKGDGGARDPLAVWNDHGKLRLLDGHQRYEICKRLHLRYAVKEIRVENRDEAKVWIILNEHVLWNLEPFLRTE